MMRLAPVVLTLTFNLPDDDYEKDCEENDLHTSRRCGE